MQNYQLPTFAELHEEDLQQAYKVDRLRQLLNNAPSQHWIKKHPTLSVKGAKLEYMSADKYEFILNKIFTRWRWEITATASHFNAMVVTGRLHYYNPAVNEWEWMDGIGAMGVQTDAGFSAADLARIKFDAIAKAAPAASTYAFKNACKKLGKIFGGDLNNDNIEEYTPNFDAPPVSQSMEPAPLLSTDAAHQLATGMYHAAMQIPQAQQPTSHYRQDESGFHTNGPSGLIHTPYQQPQEAPLGGWAHTPQGPQFVPMQLNQQPQQFTPPTPQFTF